MTSLLIYAEYDDDAEVWVAHGDDVPGLITEAETIELLVKRLKVIIPELMELNCGLTGQAFQFRLIVEQTTLAEAA
jgi:predicted RNase H-like HicB family nuclease